MRVRVTDLLSEDDGMHTQRLTQIYFTEMTLAYHIREHSSELSAYSKPRIYSLENTAMKAQQLL